MGHFLRPEGGRHARTPACHRNRRARRIGERITRAARGQGATGPAPGAATAERASARGSLATLEVGHAAAIPQRPLDAGAEFVAERDPVLTQSELGVEPGRLAPACVAERHDAPGARGFSFVHAAPEPARGPIRIDGPSFARDEPDGAPEHDGDGAIDAAELGHAGDASSELASCNFAASGAAPECDVEAPGEQPRRVASVGFASVSLAAYDVASVCIAAFHRASVAWEQPPGWADAERASEHGLARHAPAFGLASHGRSPLGDVASGFGVEHAEHASGAQRSS